MNFRVLVCVFFLSCVWQCCCGMGAEARAEQPSNDPTFQVQPKSLGAIKDDSSISSCLAHIQPPENVRFQSLKTSNGSEYARQLVTAAGLACFENSPNKSLAAATNIGDCADAAAREAPSNVSGSVRYDNTSSATLVISHDPSVCGVTDNKGYKLSWNGTQVSMVPQGVLEYSLDRRLLCYISTNISLWSIGSDGNANSEEVFVPVNRNNIFWFGLPIGGCLYHNTDSTQLDYDGSDRLCQSLGASIFVQEKEGDFMAFADAWKEYLDRHPGSKEILSHCVTSPTDRLGWSWGNTIDFL